MTVSHLRPSTTSSNTGAVTGAGGDADVAMSDDSDATFITFDEGENATFGLDNLTLPADAMIEAVRLRLRAERPTTPGAAHPTAAFILQDAASSYFKNLNGEAVISWGSPQTVTAKSGSQWDLVAGGDGLKQFTDAGLDNATLYVENKALGPFVEPDDLIVYELYATVVYITQPVVGVGLPTGTVTSESAPTIVWFQALDADEPVSSRFQAKVFTDDQVTAGGFDPETTPTFFDSGVVTKAWTTSGAWDIGETGLGLPDDDYHAYVKVAVTVNGELLWSDWDSEPFTINVDLPGQPSLLVEPDPDAGRISLTIEGASGAVDTDYFQVQRSDDGEATWENIRTELGDGLIVGPDEVQIDDYEAPNGIEVVYRVRARHDFAPGFSYSEWTDAIGIWTSDSFWMKHPTEPSLNFEVGNGDSAWYTYPGHSRAARMGVFQPIGSTSAIVVKDARGPRAGTFSVRLDEDAKKDELDTLLETESPLLVQAPQALHEPDRWVAIGDNDRERITDKGWWEPTVETMAWTEVLRPELPGAGGIVTSLPEPEPEPVEDEIDFDAFTQLTAGTGTLTGTHTPVGVPKGIVVGILQDNVGTANDEVTAVTYGGVAMTRVPGDGYVPHANANIGTAYAYTLGSGIPTGAQTVSVTVSGATNKSAGVWSFTGSGDVNVNDSNGQSIGVGANPSINLTTTSDVTSVVGIVFSGHGTVGSNAPGADYTEDGSVDLGLDTGVYMHRTTDPDEGTVGVDIVAASEVFVIIGLALGIGVSAPPDPTPGVGVLKQDLAEADDPCPVSGVNRGWRKVESAYSSGPDLNWDSSDLQIIRRTASPDPHIPVGASASTHYRRLILSECELTNSLSGSPTSLAVTTDMATFPIPSSGVGSIEGIRGMRWTGMTGSGASRTLTGVTWIDATPSSYPAGSAVRVQSIDDSGVPNVSYRTQLIRGAAPPGFNSTFYIFQPNTRRQFVFSTRFQHPTPLIGTSATTGRDQIVQWKPSPAGGMGPIFVLQEYEDSVRVFHDVTGTSQPISDFIPVDKSVGWMRFMFDITFRDTAANGRLQLFGDLDGDRLDYEDMVPLTDQLSIKTAHLVSAAAGETSNVSIGPYCRMTVAAHWRDYANVQVIDPTA